MEFWQSSFTIGNGPPARAESERSLRITLAIGGAGAQTPFARTLVRSLEEPLRRGVVSLTLVAGTQRPVARRFIQLASSIGDEAAISVVFEDDFGRYYSRFNEVLETTDILITKPSELVFYASLGLPTLMTQPLGDQERVNKEWLTEFEAGLELGDADPWSQMRSWIQDGALLRVARNGFERLPRSGTDKIAEIVFKTH
jgi:hypothetical protein